MLHLLTVICNFLWNLLNSLCNGVADGIEHKNAKQAVSNVFLILLFVADIVLVGLLLLLLAVRFWWVLLIVWLGGSLIYSMVHKDGTTDGGGDNVTDDEVETELATMRGREYHEPMRALTFYGIQGAASNTPLSRPRDEFDIETATEGDHFILEGKGKDAVYQFECDLEAPIASEEVKAQEDIMLREIQRHMLKNAPRFPLLLEDGRAPEVIDVIALGKRAVIEVIRNTPTARPIIEARRRARVERQVRQKRVEDPRYR